jgi:hypothetical protein
LARGAREKRLLGQDTSWPTPRTHRHADDRRLPSPGLGAERRICLAGGKEGQPQVFARCQQSGNEPADVRFPAAGLAGDEVKDVEPDVQCLPPVNVLKGVDRALERQPLPVATEPRSRRAPQLGPRRMHSKDGVSELLRLG